MCEAFIDEERINKHGGKIMEQTRNYNTKKEGKTEVYPFWNLSDIFNMINYFKENEDWDNYLIFMFGLLLGRRIGDTVMVKWSDFFFENGKRKVEINTIEEQKTGKFTSLPVSDYVFDCIKFYCEKTGTDHTKHHNDYVFSLECNEIIIERISGTKDGSRNGPGNQIIIPNDYVPQERFERIQNRLGIYISAIRRDGLSDYIKLYDNRPYLAEN